MRLHLRLHPAAGGGLHPDGAVEVVPDGGEDERHQHGGERPADQEVEERQAEDVEADVAAELRVGEAEVGGVDEEQPRLPLA